MGVNLYLEADEFAHLKQRLMLSGYYGKQWRSAPRFSLSTEPGLAYVSDDRIDLQKDQYFGFSWNFDMKSNVLGQSTQSYLNQVGVWNLEDNTDIVINTRIGITVPLLSKIALNVELKLDYDTGAPAGIEELDQTFKFGLGYYW
jgi:putative salt-induced outer membrane protein YdiY